MERKFLGYLLFILLGLFAWFYQANALLLENISYKVQGTGNNVSTIFSGKASNLTAGKKYTVFLDLLLSNSAKMRIGPKVINSNGTFSISLPINVKRNYQLQAFAIGDNGIEVVGKPGTEVPVSDQKPTTQNQEETCYREVVIHKGTNPNIKTPHFYWTQVPTELAGHNTLGGAQLWVNNVYKFQQSKGNWRSYSQCGKNAFYELCCYQSQDKTENAIIYQNKDNQAFWPIKVIVGGQSKFFTFLSESQSYLNTSIFPTQNVGKQCTPIAVIPPLNVGLVIDNSGSMGFAAAGQEFKISAAKRLATNFVLNTLQAQDKVAITGVSDAKTYQTLTANKQAAANAINNLVAVKDTKLHDAIIASILQLAKEPKVKRIVIALTDGNENDSTVKNESVVINYAKQNGTRVYVIGLGSKDPNQSFRGEVINEAKLRNIAQSTGGKYYSLDKINDLKSIYDSVVQAEKTAGNLMKPCPVVKAQTYPYYYCGVNGSCTGEVYYESIEKCTAAITASWKASSLTAANLGIPAQVYGKCFEVSDCNNACYTPPPPPPSENWAKLTVEKTLNVEKCSKTAQVELKISCQNAGNLSTECNSVEVLDQLAQINSINVADFDSTSLSDTQNCKIVGSLLGCSYPAKTFKVGDTKTISYKINFRQYGSAQFSGDSVKSSYSYLGQTYPLSNPKVDIDLCGGSQINYTRSVEIKKCLTSAHVKLQFECLKGNTSTGLCSNIVLVEPIDISVNLLGVKDDNNNAACRFESKYNAIICDFRSGLGKSDNGLWFKPGEKVVIEYDVMFPKFGKDQKIFQNEGFAYRSSIGKEGTAIAIAPATTGSKIDNDGNQLFDVLPCQPGASVFQTITSDKCEQAHVKIDIVCSGDPSSISRCQEVQISSKLGMPEAPSLIKYIDSSMMPSNFAVLFSQSNAWAGNIKANVLAVGQSKTIEFDISFSDLFKTNGNNVQQTGYNLLSSSLPTQAEEVFRDISGAFLYSNKLEIKNEADSVRIKPCISPAKPKASVVRRLSTDACKKVKVQLDVYCDGGDPLSSDKSVAYCSNIELYDYVPNAYSIDQSVPVTASQQFADARNNGASISVKIPALVLKSGERVEVIYGLTTPIGQQDIWSNLSFAKQENQTIDIFREQKSITVPDCQKPVLKIKRVTQPVGCGKTETTVTLSCLGPGSCKNIGFYDNSAESILKNLGWAALYPINKIIRNDSKDIISSSVVASFFTLYPFTMNQGEKITIVYRYYYSNVIRENNINTRPPSEDKNYLGTIFDPSFDINQSKLAVFMDGVPIDPANIETPENKGVVLYECPKIFLSRDVKYECDSSNGVVYANVATTFTCKSQNTGSEKCLPFVFGESIRNPYLFGSHDPNSLISDWNIANYRFDKSNPNIIYGVFSGKIDKELSSGESVTVNYRVQIGPGPINNQPSLILNSTLNYTAIPGFVTSAGGMHQLFSGTTDLINAQCGGPSLDYVGGGQSSILYCVPDSSGSLNPYKSTKAYALVVDTTNSAKIDMIKKALNRFADGGTYYSDNLSQIYHEYDYLGIVGFGKSENWISNPNLWSNSQLILGNINRNFGYTQNSAKNIIAAVNTAGEYLKNSRAEQSIVLRNKQMIIITDSENNVQEDGTICQSNQPSCKIVAQMQLGNAIAKLRQEGIYINVINLGNAQDIKKHAQASYDVLINDDKELYKTISQAWKNFDPSVKNVWCSDIEYWIELPSNINFTKVDINPKPNRTENNGKRLIWGGRPTDKINTFSVWNIGKINISLGWSDRSINNQQMFKLIKSGIKFKSVFTP